MPTSTCIFVSKPLLDYHLKVLCNKSLPFLDENIASGLSCVSILCHSLLPILIRYRSIVSPLFVPKSPETGSLTRHHGNGPSTLVFRVIDQFVSFTELSIIIIYFVYSCV